MGNAYRLGGHLADLAPAATLFTPSDAHVDRDGNDKPMHTVALDANRLCKHRPHSSVFVDGPAVLRDCGWSPLNWRHDAHVSRNVGATVRSVCRNNFNRLTLSERSPDWLARTLGKYPFSVVTTLNLIISESPEFLPALRGKTKATSFIRWNPSEIWNVTNSKKMSAEDFWHC